MYTHLDPETSLLEIILKATVSPQGPLEDNVCLGNVCKSEKWKINHRKAFHIFDLEDFLACV